LQELQEEVQADETTASVLLRMQAGHGRETAGGERWTALVIMTAGM
jgi:hypothetical protein